VAVELWIVVCIAPIPNGGALGLATGELSPLPDGPAADGAVNSVMALMDVVAAGTGDVPETEAAFPHEVSAIRIDTQQNPATTRERPMFVNFTPVTGPVRRRSVAWASGQFTAFAGHAAKDCDQQLSNFSQRPIDIVLTVGVGPQSS
jgi:hypothetical protein